MNFRKYINLLYILLGVILLLLVVYLFSSIILYFTISLILSSLLRPVTDYINSIYFFKYQIPRVFAVLCSFALLVLILTLFASLFIPLIAEQVHILSQADLDILLGRFTNSIAAVENFFINLLRLKKEPGFLALALRDNLFSFFSELELGSIINFTLQFSAAFFVSLLAIIFITFFFLYEKGLLRRNIIQLIPNQYFELTITTMHKIEKLLSNYLLGLLLQIFSIFSLTALGLTIAGINYALTIAVFAALVNVVPYIGPIIGTVFAVLVGLSTTPLPTGADSSFILLVKILLVFIVVHLIDNLISQPLIFSKSVKAHPLEIFVAIFAGAAVAGPVGMIAAIPVYTILRVSVSEFNRGYKQYHIFKVYKK